jgi:hypothetical protein
MLRNLPKVDISVPRVEANNMMASLRNGAYVERTTPPGLALTGIYASRCWQSGSLANCRPFRGDPGQSAILRANQIPNYYTI